MTIIRSSATMGEAGYIDLGDGKTYAESSVVKGLDNAIEMAPRMPNQKVWRTASAEASRKFEIKWGLHRQRIYLNHGS
jgi:hypothetical protein